MFLLVRFLGAEGWEVGGWEVRGGILGGEGGVCGEAVCWKQD